MRFSVMFFKQARKRIFSFQHCYNREDLLCFRQIFDEALTKFASLIIQLKTGVSTKELTPKVVSSFPIAALRCQLLSNLEKKTKGSHERGIPCRLVPGPEARTFYFEGRLKIHPKVFNVAVNNLPCWLFSLLPFLLFLPKIRGPLGPSPRSTTGYLQSVCT